MVGKLTPDTELSCSRLPAVMGYSPYRTPNDELAVSIDAMEGKSRTWEGNEATNWGNTLEPIILQTAAQRLGCSLEIPTKPFAAPNGTKLNASLDGIIKPPGRVTVEHDPAKGIYVIGADKIVLDGPGVLESKLTQTAAEDEPAAHRGPLQLQGCMYCAGLQWGAVAVLYRGIELRVFLYEKRLDIVAEIVRAVAEFERRKLAKDWYPPVSIADAARVYAKAEDDVPPVDLPDDAADLIMDLLTAKEVMKAAEQTIEATTSALMAMLGNALEGRVTVDDTTYRVRWPMRTYKPQPAKTTPAKEGYTIRMKTLDIKIADAA